MNLTGTRAFLLGLAVGCLFMIAVFLAKISVAIEACLP